MTETLSVSNPNQSLNVWIKKSLPIYMCVKVCMNVFNCISVYRGVGVARNLMMPSEDEISCFIFDNS